VTPTLRRGSRLLASTFVLWTTWLAAGWFPAVWSAENTPGELPTRIPAATPDTVTSFVDDVLPIFLERCAECHGGEDQSGGVVTEAYLDLLSYEGVMAGSEYGTVIEPGDPKSSTLVDMIVSGEMPEEGDLVPAEEIEVIRAWVEAGAPDN